MNGKKPGLNDDEPSELTAAEIEDLRTKLQERRDAIVASIERSREPERNAGREVGDEMDEANTEGVSSMANKLLEREVSLLREIDRALAKISEGTYGICEGTGEPIGYARLRLQPWARFSIAHQEDVERARRARGG